MGNFELYFKIILFFIFILYVYVCFPYMYVSAPHAWRASGGQKRSLNPKGLELEMFVNTYVGAGNQTQVLQLSRVTPDYEG